MRNISKRKIIYPIEKKVAAVPKKVAEVLGTLLPRQQEYCFGNTERCSCIMRRVVPAVCHWGVCHWKAQDLLNIDLFCFFVVFGSGGGLALENWITDFNNQILILRKCTPEMIDVLSIPFPKSSVLATWRAPALIRPRNPQKNNKKQTRYTSYFYRNRYFDT